ncbi:MAG: WG repeat-containing protein [Bacteroidota bacterium]|jgi:hypothetical protein
MKTRIVAIILFINFSIAFCQITTNNYDKIENNLADFKSVWLKGKVGFVNRHMQEVITPKYDSTTGFDYESKIAMVKLNGFWGGIDTLGNEIIPFLYQGSSSKAYSIWEGGDRRVNGQYLKSIIGLKLNGKFGFVDINGKEIIPFIYESINNGYSSCPFFFVKLNGKQGIIDYDGKEVYPFIIDSVLESGDGRNYIEEEWYKIKVDGKTKKIRLNRKKREVIK